MYNYIFDMLNKYHASTLLGGLTCILLTFWYYELSTRSLLIFTVIFLFLWILYVVIYRARTHYYFLLFDYYYLLFTLIIPTSLFAVPALLLLIFAKLLAPGASTLHETLHLLVALLWGAFSVAGMMQVFRVRKVSYNLPASLVPGLIGKKILLVSDTHYSGLFGLRASKKLNKIIRDIAPDILIHAGDIVDGFLYKKGQFSEHFTNLPAITDGVFFIEGNHDAVFRYESELFSALGKQYIVLLDQCISISGVQICGLRHRHRPSRNSIIDEAVSAGYDFSQPGIIIVHDPHKVAALHDKGSLVTLSGHTHGGQFFPISLLVRSSYHKVLRGLVQFADGVHITSVGYGYTGSMFRLFTPPEVVIITVTD